MKKLTFLLVTLIIQLSIKPVLAQQFEVMVYTSPDRWHDATLPIAMKEFDQMAEQHDFGLIWGQNDGRGAISDLFTEEFLSGIDVVVFLHSRGYDLTEKQVENFKYFIQNGGGFVGIHAASANRNQEEWFQQLVGRVFTDHPEEQTAVMNVQTKNHPATMHLPDNWIWTDEWYSFGEPLTDNLVDLILVDENTFEPDRTWGDDNRFTAMEDYHPVSWYQEFEGGRSFYTTLGYIPASFTDKRFLDHIYGGIYWAATGFGLYED